MESETWDIQSAIGLKLAELDIEIEYWNNLVSYYKEIGTEKYYEYYHNAQEQRDLSMEKKRQLTKYKK